MSWMVRAGLAVFLAAVPAAAEGLVYTQVSRRTHTDALGREHTETLRQTIYAAPVGLRSETEGSSIVTIMRLDEGLIYQLDLSRQLYAEVPLAEVKRRMERYKALLRAHFRRMPEEKKRRLAPVLGLGRARVRVIRSSVEVVISGVPCRKYSFYENGCLRLELWLTERYRPPADYSVFMEATGEFSPRLIALRRRYQGFAMKKRIHPVLQANPAVENTVLGVERRPLPEDLFRVPEGFRKVPSVLPEGAPGAKKDGKTAPPVPVAPSPVPDEPADAPLPD